MPLSKQQIAILLAEKAKHGQGGQPPGASTSPMAPAMPKPVNPMVPSTGPKSLGVPKPALMPKMPGLQKEKFPKLGKALKLPKY